MILRKPVATVKDMQAKLVKNIIQWIAFPELVVAREIKRKVAQAKAVVRAKATRAHVGIAVRLVTRPTNARWGSMRWKWKGQGGEQRGNW